VAGCYRAGWLVLLLGMPVFLWLFVAQDECFSGFSVVLWSRLVALCSWMQWLPLGTVVMLCMSSGMMGWLVACAWHAGGFVVVYGPGRVLQRLQRGAVGPGCRLVALCSWMQWLVCLGQVRFGFTSRFWHVCCAL